MRENKPEICIVDVDGVLTSGKFLYTKDGKVMKEFGPDDHEAIKLLEKHIPVIFVTGDKRGFAISHKRVAEDMGFPLYLVDTRNRLAWIQKRYDLKKTIYIADGIFDALVFKHVFYSIAPANADEQTQKAADYVTKRNGGDRALSEASFHIIDIFFEG